MFTIKIEFINDILCLKILTELWNVCKKIIKYNTVISNTGKSMAFWLTDAWRNFLNSLEFSQWLQTFEYSFCWYIVDI